LAVFGFIWLYFHTIYFKFLSAEKTFILSGVDLPSPASDPAERQKQLKLTVTTILAKLDPALTSHEIMYVRVIKSPKPSILEVECTTSERYDLTCINLVEFM